MLSRWNKFGRFITGIVVVCFFLPFFGVSCQGVDVVTVSGADMVGGCQPGGMLVDAANQQEAKHPGMATGDVKIDNVKREPLAIVALAICIIAAGLAWVRSRGALVGAFVLAIAGIGALTGLYIKVNGEMKEEIAKNDKKDGGGGAMAKDMSKDVDSGSRFGLWIVVLGLAGTAVLTGLALKEPESTPGATTPPQA